MEHSETCTCIGCVPYYRVAGQTDPYGYTVVVEWDVVDGLAHAEWIADGVIDNLTQFVVDDMDTLVNRINGRYFDDAGKLATFLRDVTGSRDFE
jgi:hypothetical protein